MSEELVLPVDQFAAWSRRSVPGLPFPIDLSGVDAADAADVTVSVGDSPELRLLRRVLGAERVSAFMVRADPNLVTDCAVAVAADRDAAVLRNADGLIRVRRTGESDLVSAIAATLPALAALRIPLTELAESAWTRMLSLLARGGPLDPQALHDLGLPRDLVSAMVAAVIRPVPVGTVGAMAWCGRTALLGPTVGSWHEYPGGAVVTRVHASRRTGGRTQVLIGPYDTSDLARTLSEAVSTALYRAREVG